jgi:hypothetical protein
MQSTVKPFASDADLEAARIVAEKFSKSGDLVKPIGVAVLTALEEGEDGLPVSAYEKLARLCQNKSPDRKSKVKSGRELSISLFGCVIEPSK